MPEIPGNTGSIGRTCVALGIELILIRPYGFDLSEKAVRRAGLDYWQHLWLSEYDSWEDFVVKRNPESLLLFENHQDRTIYSAPFKDNSYLVFGSETKGISEQILGKYQEHIYCLPMYSDKIRSLNLSNAVSAVAYQCLGRLNL
jgi:tRNA (cytidine/uridine-2'-O-)-methyltransferase